MTCAVDGCQRERWTGGLCGTHGMRKRRGQPLGEGLPPRPNCTVAGCTRQQHAQEICHPHWLRVRRHGTATAGGAPRAAKGSGHVGRDGYRTITIDGRKRPEHVLVMEAALGRALLPGETVHHLNGQRADNRLENLELWSRSQPAGQRVVDKVAWAKDLLALYEPTALGLLDA